MFLKRSYDREIMDDFSIQDRRIDEALSELKIANKYLGGISTTMAGLNILLNREKEISILDVGAGGSDNLIFLRNKFTGIKITSIDLNKRVCKFLKRSHVGNTICADVLNVPVRSKQVDIVHASLFLHHFNEDKIKKMLVDFLNISKKGIIINDLRRSIPALIGIKIIAALFSKSEMFKNDGPISVRRGFVKKDWRIMLKESGIKKFEIKRKWAFRWLIVIYNE
ncbi:MAG: hypothetical protein CO128_06005 [Ignavibacteriales bacterium CG_4_9_14_3_um_filter_30_11]|nr:MAG: hypothetical protein CO128_06005 [Ignavibacteriales bacterium CG_4_9_14_3_um_filter_30_11]